MPYDSPTEVDLAEVYALNSAFLALLKARSICDRVAPGLAQSARQRLGALDEAESARLARAPFLLLSLRESDSGYWDGTPGDPGAYDLFDAAEQVALGRLTAAALAYVWQLSRQNPYTLRLICCATLHWCERIAEQSLVDVLDRAGERESLLELRANDEGEVWDRLLRGGTDPRDAVRRCTHRSVLQALLIRPAVRRRRWRQAACRSRVPALSILSKD